MWQAEAVRQAQTSADNGTDLSRGGKTVRKAKGYREQLQVNYNLSEFFMVSTAAQLALFALGPKNKLKPLKQQGQVRKQSKPQ